MKQKYLGVAAIAAVLVGAWVTGHLDLWAALAVGGGVTVFGMILDERTEFADATSMINAAVSLVLKGDVIDTSVARNLGSPPRPLYLVIQITTTVLAAGGAASVAFVLASDSLAAIAVDGTATEHIRTQLIPKASLVAGFTFCVPLPGELPAYERFVGVLLNIITNDVTAGAFNAFLTHDPKQWKAYDNAL